MSFTFVVSAPAGRGGIFSISLILGLLLLILIGAPPERGRAATAALTDGPSATAEPSPALDKAAQDLAEAVERMPAVDAVFAHLVQGGFAYDENAAIALQNMLECREPRMLALLAGLYRADAGYAAAFGQWPHPALRDALNTAIQGMKLPASLTQALLLPKATQTTVQSSTPGLILRRGEAHAARASEGQARSLVYLLDMHYAQVLQQAHVMACLAQQMRALEQEGRQSLMTGWATLGRGVNVLRSLLLGWTAQPQLVRELGLFRQLSHLDELLMELEMLRGAPSEMDGLWLGKFRGLVEDVRGELTEICPLQPRENLRQRDWRLSPRNDLFRPKNFF